MGIQLKNNASGTLATAINASDTGIVLTTGNGASFPALGASDYFYATLESTGGTFEVIKVTVRSGDSMTVVRAQEGSTANSFAAGSRIELRVTAASVEDLVDEYDNALRADLAASTGSSLVGFLQVGANAILRTTQAKLRDVVSVKDFGADSTGATDSTAAINSAIVYAMAGGHHTVYFPQGSYQVSTILISNPAYILTLLSDGAEFQGNATVPTNGIFDLVNCYDFNMLGAYKLNVGGNANYSAGLSIRSAAGGNGGTSRNSFYNITVRQAKIGISVGEYNVDLACSELDFFGCKFFQCPVTIYNGGSQTLSQWQGCEIISEPFAGYPGAAERAIWIEGGAVAVTGGSIVKGNTATPQTILFNPASSVTYGNPYGTLRIAGTHIESNCQLLTIANSRSLTTPGSTSSNVTIVASGGYAGLSASEDFITISDSTYAGTVEATSCNFYAPSARSAYSISCVSANPVLVTDYRSFGNNFRPWYNGGFSFGTDASIFPYNGSYTATATGMTTSPTGTIRYSRIGKSVTMSIPNIFGTSNSAQFTLTGGDAAMRPTANRVTQVVVGDNGGAAVMAIAIIGTNGIIQLFANLSGAVFTASGTKAVGECAFSYVI